MRLFLLSNPSRLEDAYRIKIIHHASVQRYNLFCCGRSLPFLDKAYRFKFKRRKISMFVTKPKDSQIKKPKESQNNFITKGFSPLKKLYVQIKKTERLDLY